MATLVTIINSSEIELGLWRVSNTPCFSRDYVCWCCKYTAIPFGTAVIGSVLKAAGTFILIFRLKYKL